MNMENTENSVIAVVCTFNEALNRGDLNEMMAAMTLDCIFENTYPPPDGERFEGQAAVRLFWEDFLQSTTGARIEIEEIFTLGDRCVMRWVYHWVSFDGSPGRIRGVDIYRIEKGLIAEKLSYVKG